MKKSIFALILLLLFVGLWAAGDILDISGLNNLGLMTLVGVALVLAYCYLRFEESGSDTKIVAVVGTLAALSVAGRVLFAVIPNVQPSTFIIIVSGYVFGPMAGFMVGSTTALVSNIFLGHGPWTLWQMLAWGLAGLASGSLGPKRRLEGRWKLALYCAAWGFFYGWIVNAYFVLGFVHPLSVRSVVAAYGMGLWFDLFHAAGNFAFAFLLGPALVTMLRRYRSRFLFESEPARIPEGAETGGSC
ncbi:MAG: ECF transporter S component [Actinobacteria bacterium]|nr:ECF transporter S component [Actinomycetota bacterium]MBU4386648.1 ECF transporter S component [Actinomycetota bacterium]